MSAPPVPYEAEAKTWSLMNSGDEQMTFALESESLPQSNRPSAAFTPTTPTLTMSMYCRIPPTSATIGDAYAAPGEFGTGHFQRTAPVALSSAAIVALRPPGVQISFWPSISTDSE